MNVSIEGASRLVTLTGSADELVIGSDGKESRYRILWRSGHQMAVEHDGRQIVFAWRRTPNGVDLMVDGELWEAEVEKGGAKRSRRREDDHSLSAPMPGSVLRVLTTVGAEVNKGDALVVLEAMKMEHTIAAPYAGTVEKIGCSEGDMVQPGVDLISIKPAEEDET